MKSIANRAHRDDVLQTEGADYPRDRLSSEGDGVLTQFVGDIFGAQAGTRAEWGLLGGDHDERTS
jgi:hypothetical protein